MRLSIENYKLLNFKNDNITTSPEPASRATPQTLLETIKKLHHRTNISKDDLSNLLNEYNLDYEDACRSLETSVDLESDKSLLS